MGKERGSEVWGGGGEKEVWGRRERKKGLGKRKGGMERGLDGGDKE